MAFGGLLDTLAPTIDVPDGWGGTIAMTHRAWTVAVGVLPEVLQPTAGAVDPVAAYVAGQLGKIVAGEFKASRDVPPVRATFLLSEVKALGNGITIVALLAAAKTKLGL
jgi:hypothetical protein